MESHGLMRLEIFMCYDTLRLESRFAFNRQLEFLDELRLMPLVGS